MAGVVGGGDLFNLRLKALLLNMKTKIKMDLRGLLPGPFHTFFVFIWLPWHLLIFICYGRPWRRRKRTNLKITPKRKRAGFFLLKLPCKQYCHMHASMLPISTCIHNQNDLVAFSFSNAAVQLMEMKLHYS